MVWGCDSGSPAMSVAVADLSFAVRDSIKTNVENGAGSAIQDFDASDSASMALGTSKLDHGTRVASVIAAVGNDGHGMTGEA